MSTSTWLAHHGIFGQKWGVRRFQNYDGSYTTAGKARYSKQQVIDDFEASAAQNKDAMDRIMNNGVKISDEADALGKEYAKAYKEAKLDQKAIDRINKKLEEDFGVGSDDEEWFNEILREYVEDELRSQVGKKLSDKRQKFDKLQEDYWNDVEKIVGGLKEKYNDASISSGAFDKNVTDGRSVINELLGSRLDTSMPSYIYRHFDDYWVDDIDENYDAIERLMKESGITMNKYNKAHGS